MTVIYGALISMTAMFGLGYLLGEQRGWNKGVAKMQEIYQ